MPLDHNFNAFARALQQAPQQYKQEVQNPLANFIGVRFGRTAVQDYMTEGPKTFGGHPGPRPQGQGGPLRILSGRLRSAVEGTKNDSTSRGPEFESEDAFDTTEQGFVWSRTIYVPYALIHEKGGTIPTSPAMESALWALYYETDYDAYKYMALAAKKKTHFSIPARPYAEPALRDIIPIVEDKAEKLLDSFISKRI